MYCYIKNYKMRLRNISTFICIIKLAFCKITLQLMSDREVYLNCGKLYIFIFVIKKVALLASDCNF